MEKIDGRVKRKKAKEDDGIENKPWIYITEHLREQVRKMINRV